jgi:hypothetical protein
MHFGICGINDEVNIIKLKKLVIIREGLAAGIDLLGNTAAEFVRVNNVFYVVIKIVLAAVILSVYILTASALTDNGEIELFHYCISFKILFLLFPDEGIETEKKREYFKSAKKHGKLEDEFGKI